MAESVDFQQFKDRIAHPTDRDLRLAKVLTITEKLVANAEGRRADRTALQTVTDFFGGPAEPGREILEEAKKSLGLARKFFLLGNLPKADQLSRMAFKAVMEADGNYSQYQTDSIEHGIFVSKVGPATLGTLFAIGITGGLAAAALPGLLVLAGKGLGGSLLAFGAMTMGGGSGLALAGMGKRYLYSFLGGEEKAMDEHLVRQDFQEGAVLSSMNFFTPFANAAGALWSHHARGIGKEALRLLPHSLIQSGHGMAQVLAEGGDARQVAAAGAMGLVLPFFFRGLERAVSLPAEFKEGLKRQAIARFSQGLGIQEGSLLHRYLQISADQAGIPRRHLAEFGKRLNGEEGALLREIAGLITSSETGTAYEKVILPLVKEWMGQKVTALELSTTLAGLKEGRLNPQFNSQGVLRGFSMRKNAALSASSSPADGAVSVRSSSLRSPSMPARKTSNPLLGGVAIALGGAPVLMPPWLLHLADQISAFFSKRVGKKLESLPPPPAGHQSKAPVSTVDPRPRKPSPDWEGDFGPHYFLPDSFYASLPQGGFTRDGISYWPILPGLDGKTVPLKGHGGEAGTVTFTGRIFGQGSASTVYEGTLQTTTGETRTVAIKISDHSTHEDPAHLKRAIDREIERLVYADCVQLWRVAYFGEVEVQGHRGRVMNVAPGISWKSPAVGGRINDRTVEEFNMIYNQLEFLGFKPGDIEFTIARDGSVRLVDLEGIDVRSLEPEEMYSRERALERLEELRKQAASQLASQALSAGPVPPPKQTPANDTTPEFIRGRNDPIATFSGGRGNRGGSLPSPASSTDPRLLPPAWASANMDPRKLEAFSLMARDFHHGNLDRMLETYPGKKGGYLADQVVTPEGIQNYLWREARRLNLPLAQGFHEDALLFWDILSRQQGYESLEHFLMIHAGYEASSYLPAEMRAHRPEGVEIREEGGGDFHKQWVEKRVGELQREWGKKLPPGVKIWAEREGLFKIFADYEFFHPEWRNILRLEDFVKKQTEFGEHWSLQPNSFRARRLLDLARQGRPDVFPEFTIPSNLTDAHLDGGLRSFLVKYRAAEGLIYDGGRELMHCGDSTRLLVNLFVSKGLEAFPVTAHRFNSYVSAGNPDARYGLAIQKFAQEVGVDPLTARKILVQLTEQMTPEEIRLAAKDTGVPAKTVHKAHDLFGRRSEEERELLQAQDGWGHTIAGVKINGRYYLVDINGQQYGDAYDRLLFIPEEEAAANGIILGGTLSRLHKAHQNSRLHEQVKGLTHDYDAGQKIIREYMGIRSPRAR